MPALPRSILATAALLAGLAPALANDSTAEMGLGGLELTRSGDIEMLSEDLFLSMEEVRVVYRFKNTQPKDIDTLVAFPIPDLPGGEDFFYHVLPIENVDNFVDFKITVDGQPVAPKLEQRAIAHHLDRTALLVSLGIPLLPGNPARDALDKLPEEKKLELERLGLAFREEDPDAKTSKMIPLWSVANTFYWDQKFPAGREIEVAHRYRPIVGSTAGLNFDPKKPNDNRDYVTGYCMDKAFLDAVGKMDAAARKKNTIAVEHRLSYVLTTGANWAGPIKSFRLVVDKGRADRLVSFCAKGVKKLGPTQFEWTATDFLPDADLDVLFVEVPPEN